MFRGIRLEMLIVIKIFDLIQFKLVDYSRRKSFFRKILTWNFECTSVLIQPSFVSESTKDLMLQKQRIQLVIGAQAG